MPWVRIERKVPTFAQAKTVHATDRSATVTGNYTTLRLQKYRRFLSTQVKQNSFLHSLFKEYDF
jgi:hypothetical protein